jgi:hypothetical protein
MAGIEGGMPTLPARGRLPGLRVGSEHAHGALLDGGRPLAWPAAAMRDDPVRLLPWRLLAPPHHPAGHAKSQHRQHHADGTPQRPASHRQQCAGQGPDQRAVQQPGQRRLSWWMRVGAGHGASSGHRDTVQVRRWPANGLVRNSQQATEPRLRGATVARYCRWWRRRVPEDMWRRRPKNAISAGALQRHAPPPMQRVVLRHPAGAAISGRAGNASTPLARWMVWRWEVRPGRSRVW